MKKLLAILGSASLVATTGMTVVACNKDTGPIEPPVPPVTGKDEINKLIKQLESEVNGKWTTKVANPMADSATLLDTEASQSDLAFLEKTNLQDVYNRAKAEQEGEEQEPVSFYSILNDNEKNMLKNNLDSLLSPAAKINDLKKAISASEYQIILSSLGANWMEDIIFDYNNAILNYTDVEQSFLANIEIGYSMKYSYMDAEDTKQSKTQKSNVSITISDDGVIIDAIKVIQDQFAGDLLKSGDPLVWIDQKALKVDPAEIIGGKTEKYNVALEEYYKKLAQEIKTKIQDDYFAKSESPILKAVKTSLANPEDVVRTNSKVSEIGMLDLERAELTKLTSNMPAGKPNSNEGGVIYPDELKRQKLYLGAVENDASINLGDGSKATNATLHKDLQKPFEDNKSQHDASFKLNYRELIEKSTSTEEAANIEELLSASVVNEQVTIKGISFELNNGYKQNLNDIKMNLSVGVDNTSANEQTIEGKMFAAYYNASANILNQFHKFYGVSPTDIDELAGDATFEQKGLLFYMTGKSGAKKSDGSEFNIWEYWANLDDSVSPFGEDKRPSIRMTNDALNLNAGNDPEVNKIKNENFISLLQGTENFSLNSNQWSPSTGRNVNSYTLADSKSESGLDKGMRAKGMPSTFNTLQFFLTNDIFNILLGEEEPGSGNWKDHNFYSFGSQEWTMIGKK